MKRTLTGIVAASMVLGTMAPAAFASTTNTFTSGGGKTISLDGTTLYSGVQVGNALDSGTTTTYFPIWYLEQALTKAGYTTSYNPSTSTWDITMPGTDASKISVDGGVGTGNAAISINGVVVKKFNAQWQKDLAGGANASVTTYFPLYYLSKVLSASGFSNAWDGFNFAFTKYVAPSFAVSSVTAINGGQLLVKFNKAVDSTTATTTGNYTLTDAAGPVAHGTPVLQADGMSVIVPLTTAIANSTSDDISATVANVQVSNDPSQVIPTFSTVVHVADTTAPTITSVTASTNGTSAGQATINFSEPVALGAAIKVDGTYVTSTAAGSSQTITVSLAANQTHTVQIVNLTDASGNITPLATATFGVTVDSSMPVVSSLAASGDKTLLVTFNKAVTLASVNAALTAGGLKDEAYNPVATGTATVVTAGATTSDTQFSIPITQANLYTTTQTSRNLTLVLAAGVTDTLNNTTTTAITKTVSLTEDLTKPVVTGMTFDTDPANGKVKDVVLKLSKGLKAGAVTTSGITVTDPNGVDVTGTFLAAAANPAPAAGDTSIVVPLQAETTLTGVYNFSVPAGIITDNTFTGNTNAAASFTVNFGAATAASISVAGVSNPSTNVIKVDFGSGNAVKGGAVSGSATNPAAYTLNGSSLPVGTTVTLDPTFRYATITLPTGTVATSDPSAVFTVNGVLTTAGGTVKAYTGTTAIVDNTAPVLQSAQVFGNQILLTYNEAIATLPAGLASDATPDFAVSVNGVALTLTGGSMTAANQPGNSKQIMLTITPGTGNWDNTKTIAVTTQGTDVTDQSTLANVQTANVSVTAH